MSCSQRATHTAKPAQGKEPILHLQGDRGFGFRVKGFRVSGYGLRVLGFKGLRVLGFRV